MSIQQEMISPFVGNQVSDGVISYGLSSYGYDIRCGDTFRICHRYDNDEPAILDAKKVSERMFTTFVGNECIIPPNCFALTSSLEKVRIPRHVLALCIGKSTYARCGIILNATPLEPEWSGHITLEISNTTPYYAKIYANEGIAQLLFFESDETCRWSYGDKKGKYQNQHGIKLATVC